MKINDIRNYFLHLLQEIWFFFFVCVFFRLNLRYFSQMIGEISDFIPRSFDKNRHFTQRLFDENTSLNFAIVRRKYVILFKDRSTKIHHFIPWLFDENTSLYSAIVWRKLRFYSAVVRRKSDFILRSSNEIRDFFHDRLMKFLFLFFSSNWQNRTHF